MNKETLQRLRELSAKFANPSYDIMTCEKKDFYAMLDWIEKLENFVRRIERVRGFLSMRDYKNDGLLIKKAIDDLFDAFAELDKGDE